MRTYDAQVVAAEEIEHVYALVLSERRDGIGMRLEIQNGPHDDQDRSLGMDTYCLCTESGACHYGGIKNWKFDTSDGYLYLYLDRDACEELGVDGGLKIRISESDAQMLIDSLHRLLGSA